MSRHARSTEETDHNIITIFLPIISVAIAACAASCFYMERRRKKRMQKRGGSEFLQDDNISDTESIATSTSSRFRPYMLPSATTGRTFRSSSRQGSSRGVYDFDSSYGEPPPYSGGGSRRSSIASLKALQEDDYRRKGMYNEAFLDSRNSLHRSKSMLDMRDPFDSAPLRRTRSSVNLQRPRYRDYPESNGPRFNDDMALQRLGVSSSPAMSEWSIRTAPQASAFDHNYPVNRPSSVASLPTRGRRGNMRRSVSQPNLSRSSLTKTGTYPQGILKRNGATMSDGGRNHENISDFEVKDFYGKADSDRGGRAMSDVMNDSRPSTRPRGGYEQSRYNEYFDGGNDNYPGHPKMRQRGYEDSVYSASSAVPYPHYPSGSRDWGSQYPHNHDPYSYGGGNYWDQQNRTQSQQYNPYVYGSMIY